MEQSKFAIISKIALILIILITPFRYASKSHKTEQKREDLKQQCDSVSKHILSTIEETKELNKETEKLNAEISVMKVHVEKKIQ